jgi:DNA modification methylase
MSTERSEFQTTHRLIQGDARHLDFIPNESIHLVVTSPPYWILKRYNENPDQLGHVADYEQFIEDLSQVWEHMYRILVPGGRLVCVVGDVCLSRRKHGRHVVVPLHADICVSCRKIGFDNLNPIIWHKISNASIETANLFNNARLVFQKSVVDDKSGSITLREEQAHYSTTAP